MSYTLADYQLANNFYFRLESEHPAASRFMKALHITITESLSSMLPMMVMEYADQFGDLFNYVYVHPNYPMTITFGKDRQSNVQTEFLPASSAMVNETANQSTEMDMKLVWMHPAWTELTRDTVSTVYEQQRVSDIVKDIVVKAGLEPDIEATATASDIIQPHWTHQRFIKWLLSQSENEEGNGGYHAWTTMDNRFHFKSLDRLLKGPTKRTLTLAIDDRSKQHKIGRLSLNQQVASLAKGAAFGVRAMHFDFEKKAWITRDRSITDNTVRQTSDKIYLSADHNNAKKLFYTGTDKESIRQADNAILNSLVGAQTLNVQLHGDPLLHAGDLVSVDLYAKTEEGNKKSTNYSGDWLVYEVKHAINLDIGSYQTFLTLVNLGINVSRYDHSHFDELVETSTGKV